MNDIKNKQDLGYIGALMSGGGFLGMFVSLLAAWFFSPIASFVLIAISGLSTFAGFILMAIAGKIEDNQHLKNQALFQLDYNEYTQKMGVVKSNTTATLFDADRFGNKIPQYIWVANNRMNLFPKAEYYINYATSSVDRADVSELKLRTIPLRSILYFEEIGELRQFAMVSGGGTSLKGALLGYALAEDLGAIICSREPITTEIVSNDDRRIELIYKNQNNDIENLEFTHDAYSVFKQLIPSKELRRICALNSLKEERNAPGKSAPKNQTVKKKLKQLQGLMDEGLITEEEFMQKKQKILDSI